MRREFAYDEPNRRVEKTVKNRTSATVRSRERFLHEGWNLGVHFGFATQYTDAESGLVSFGHRYYSPTARRLL